MAESTFQKISRKTGNKPSNCKCQLCKSQCQTPCLATPEDVADLMKAGYGDRLVMTSWRAGIMLGVTKQAVEMIQPLYDEAKGSCTFFTDGLCELHESGLKPTEGKLSHHSTRATNFNVKKSISWAVAKEWISNPIK